jgi:alkyl hydroperoxide reductase subunit AhpF
MSLFDDKVKEQLKNLLGALKDNVNIVYFTQEFECHACNDCRTFLEEISELSDKIILTIFDFQKDKAEADRHQIDKIPAIVIADNNNNDTGIRFFGVPAGYEINSFISSLVEVSGVKKDLPPEIASRISKITRDIHIQVFVTLT